MKSLKIALFTFVTAFAFMSQASQNSEADSAANQTAVKTICHAITSENGIKELSSKSILEIKTLSAASAQYLNQHLLDLSYTEKTLSLKEMQALFSKGGEYQYDELHITLLLVKENSQKLIQTKSYPGDNPYALFFDAKTGKLVALEEDSSIAVLVNNKKVYCE